MSEPGAFEQRPAAPAAAESVPESIADNTVRNIQKGMEKGRRQQDLEKAGLVFEKIPKSVYLGMTSEQRKSRFIGLSGNAQDYLLEQFDEGEIDESFWKDFDPKQQDALKLLQKFRKEKKKGVDEAADPENGLSLGDRQENVAPDIDQEGKEFVHDLDRLLQEGRTPNGGLNNIDVVKPLLAIDGMTKKDAVAILKSRDITDQDTVNALTAGLIDGDEEEREMTAEEKAKNEELQQTNEVLKRQMLDADDRLEKEKDEHPERADEINAMQRKLRNFSTMFGGFFAEGEPGREYARKGKKWLYYLLVTTIVLLLMECNLIYKAAAGRKK